METDEDTEDISLLTTGTFVMGTRVRVVELETVVEGANVDDEELP